MQFQPNHNIARILYSHNNTVAKHNGHPPIDTSPHLADADIKHIQWVIGSILYYARAMGLTVLMALSTIASKQAHGTKNAMQKTKQLLPYLATHLDATVQFHA
jgi:hypothetical protein